MEAPKQIKASIAVNAEAIEVLKKYLSEEQAIEAAKEITLILFKTRHSMKEAVIQEFKKVYEPDFSVPGHEILPANTIETIRAKFNYEPVITAKPEEIEFRL